MKSFVPTDLQKLALDAYRGISTKFSKGELQDAVRNAVLDACGGEWNLHKFLKNQHDIFALIEELMLTPSNASLAGKFDRFADFKDTALGDLNYFEVEDSQIYNVLTVSRGNADIDRQRIVNRNFSIPTIQKAIKFYDEFDRFMTGKIDFGMMTDRATSAFENYIALLIYDAIYGSYSAVDTEFKATGAYSATVLAGIIENVKAATGAENVEIWGTQTALGSVADGAGYSDRAKDDFNKMGYYGEFRGSSLMSLPQGYRPSTQTLAVNNASLIIIPANEKIVKVVFEGGITILMTDGLSHNALQPEVSYIRRIGAGALTTQEGMYGFYKLV